MPEVLLPLLIKLRANDELVHDLAEAARRDPLTLGEFACRELRNAIAPDPAGRLAPCP